MMTQHESTAEDVLYTGLGEGDMVNSYSSILLLRLQFRFYQLYFLPYTGLLLLFVNMDIGIATVKMTKNIHLRYIFCTVYCHLN